MSSAAEVNGRDLYAGDAVAAQDEPDLVLETTSNETEIMVFDVQ
ncbi:MAG TPA: hypothetical protein VFO74_15280 [Pseudolabrys sp.]|nr:hypothetical protein [Pseudolabrys sp.]